MSDFKFIYFWEYIYWLWVWFMGFVFIIFFGFFVVCGMVDRLFLKCLGVVFLLAVFVAFFGWIMVVSGFIDCFWVNVYKLIMYLLLVLILFSYLFWIILKVM